MELNQIRPNANDPLLDTRQVAEKFGSTTQFVEKLRTTGEGPEFLKIGRLVRYRASAVDRWLDEQAAKSTTEARRVRKNRAA
jgi:predicted DNA-binding transcriptional regulator AlpA